MKSVNFTLKYDPWEYVYIPIADRLKYSSRISTKLLFSLEIQHVMDLTYAALEAVHQ